MHQLLALSVESYISGTPALVQISAPNAIQCGANGCFNAIISGIIDLMFLIALVSALAFLIWGGLDWIMSEGDKAKLQKARMKLVYALIGLIIVFFGFFIVNSVGKLLGVQLFGISL